MAYTAEQRAARIKMVEILQAKARNKRRRLIDFIYPDEDIELPLGFLPDHKTTSFAREKYQKHLEFFRAGATYRERCAMCANRIGKSFGMGGYEMSVHLTGEYPDWWEGKRFDSPIRAWAAGKSNETTRDILQSILLGELATSPGGRKTPTGTGLIPGRHIGAIQMKSGVPDMLDTAKIRHVSGGWSRLGFKSYQQGRGSFEGTAQHVIWFDEEVPDDIYGEGLIRTATTNGIVMLTFTPLEGLTEVAQKFLPQDWSAT